MSVLSAHIAIQTALAHKGALSYAQTGRKNTNFTPLFYKYLSINILTSFPAQNFCREKIALHFCLDSDKFPSKQNFFCVLTEKYFRIDGNLRASLRKKALRLTPVFCRLRKKTDVGLIRTKILFHPLNR
jgi:hypothetical protein